MSQIVERTNAEIRRVQFLGKDGEEIEIEIRGSKVDPKVVSGMAACFRQHVLEHTEPGAIVHSVILTPPTPRQFFNPSLC